MNHSRYGGRASYIDVGLLMKQSDTAHDYKQPAELGEPDGLFEEEIVNRSDEQIS